MDVSCTGFSSPRTTHAFLSFRSVLLHSVYVDASRPFSPPSMLLLPSSTLVLLRLRSLSSPPPPLPDASARERGGEGENKRTSPTSAKLPKSAHLPPLCKKNVGNEKLPNLCHHHTQKVSSSCIRAYYYIPLRVSLSHPKSAF